MLVNLIARRDKAYGSLYRQPDIKPASKQKQKSKTVGLEGIYIKLMKARKRQLWFY